jgi:hypothetical protein
MSHRNFDQALEASQIDLSDVTFELGGREWHLGQISDFMLMKWVSQTNDNGRAGLLTELMTRFTVEDEREDWIEFLSAGRTYEVPGERPGSGEDEAEPEPVSKYAHPPNLGGYVQLINWAIEQQSERRPTTPS